MWFIQIVLAAYFTITVQCVVLIRLFVNLGKIWFTKLFTSWTDTWLKKHRFWYYYISWGFISTSLHLKTKVTKPLKFISVIRPLLLAGDENWKTIRDWYFSSLSVDRLYVDLETYFECFSGFLFLSIRTVSKNIDSRRDCWAVMIL